MTPSSVTTAPGRWLGAVVVSFSVGFAGLTIATAHADQMVSVAVLVALILWGTATDTALLLGGGSTDPGRTDPFPDGNPSEAAGQDLTTIVRVGDEPEAILRTTVALAATAGPVVVVSTEPERATDYGTNVAVYHCDTIADGITAAAGDITTTAALLVSGRAFGSASQCRAAAAQLDFDQDLGWITGRSEPFDRDRFGSDERDTVNVRVRQLLAPRGLTLWETDATIVRSSDLRDHPVAEDRPLGDWLRDRAASGSKGTQVQSVLTLRSAPVAGSAFWPDNIARQRAAAADLSGALVHPDTSVRSRCAAAAMLVRTLYGWSLLTWLLLPALLTAGFPLKMSPIAWIAVAGATNALRWVVSRHILELEFRPRSTLVSALYNAPGSITTTSAAMHRRIRSPRIPVPTRPLVWAALGITLVAGYGLLSYAPGTSGSRAAAAASVVLLGLLWMFTVRSLLERTWDRTGFRVALDLPATLRTGEVGALRGRVVDGSPGGLAFIGARSSLVVGDEVTVSLSLDSVDVSFAAVVASRRRRHGQELLGIELRSGGEALARWSTLLVRSARDTSPETRPVLSHTESSPTSRWERVLDRLLVGIVLLTSAVVLAALALAMVGYRPLVIRSGSMVPTYEVGDVVLVEQLPASELKVGDVANRPFDPDVGESTTHRVVTLGNDGSDIEVTTQGDANSHSETWTVAPDEVVGRVAFHVPWIGTPATLVRTSTAGVVVGIIAVALFLAALFWRRRPGGEASVDASYQDVFDPELGDRGRTGTGQVCQ